MKKISQRKKKKLLRSYGTLFTLTTMLAASGVAPAISFAEAVDTAETNTLMFKSAPSSISVDPQNLLKNPTTTMENGNFPNWVMKYSNSDIGTLVLSQLTNVDNDGFYTMGDKVKIKSIDDTQGQGFVIASDSGKYSAGTLEQGIPVKAGQTYKISFDVQENGSGLLFDQPSGHVVYSFGQENPELKSETVRKSDGKLTKEISYTATADGTADLLIQGYNQYAGLLSNFTSKLTFTNLKLINSDVTPPEKPSVTTVADTTSRTLQGVGEPDSTIIVSDANGTELGRTATDNYGAYTVDIPRQVAGTSLYVTNQDYAGNISSGTEVIFRQGALDTPTIDQVTNESTAITGTADKGAYITVVIDKLNGTQNSYTGEADLDGHYNVSVPTPAFGETVTVQSNLGGYKSEKETAKVADVITPAAPVVDAITNEDTAVTGFADVGNTIQVTLQDGSILNGEVTKEGAFSVDIPAQAVGSKISVTQTKPSGLVSAQTEVTVIRTAIAAPVVDPITDKSTVITGSGEAYSDVHIDLTNAAGEIVNSYDGATNSQGKFSIPVANLSDITFAEVTLTKGELSSKTVRVAVGDTVAPFAPSVNGVVKEDTKITGVAEANSTVIASVAGKEIGRATADNNGDFLIDIAKQNSGTVISIVAVDASLNVSDATEITVDDVKLASPIVNEVTNVSTSISGQSVANATIYIEAKTADGSIITTFNGNADSTGKFSFLTSALPAGSYLEVTAKKDDLSSNIVKVEVKDAIAPTAPSVDSVSEYSDVLTGETEANATVVATVDGIEIGRAEADSKGQYKITINPQKLGTKISVVAIDGAGNTSEATTVEVGTTTGTISIDPYSIGSEFVTGSYTGDVKSANLIIDGKLVSWGGDFKDGKFTYYVGAGTLKSENQVAVLEATDVNKKVLDTKDIEVTNNAQGTITPDSYSIGNQFITGTYTGDVKQARLVVNGKVLSWGGEFKDGKFSYYVGSGTIYQASDVVTLDAYDAYQDQLAANIPVTIHTASAEVKTADYTLGSEFITGTYAGDGVRGAKLTVNGKAVSWGGTFNDGAFNFYVGSGAIKTGDVVKLDLYDAFNNTISSESYVVNVQVSTGKITSAVYKEGDEFITGTYEGNIKRAQVKINGEPGWFGGTFDEDGTFTYYVGSGKIKAGDAVTIDGLDNDYNYLVEAAEVVIQSAE